MPLLTSWFSESQAKRKSKQQQYWIEKGLCPGCGSAKFRTKLYEPGPEALAAGQSVEYRTVCIYCGAEKGKNT